MRSLSQDQGIWRLTGHLSSLSQELRLLGLLYFQIWRKCVGLIWRKRDCLNISPLVRWIIPCWWRTYCADLSKSPRRYSVFILAQCTLMDSLVYFSYLRSTTTSLSSNTDADTVTLCNMKCKSFGPVRWDYLHSQHVYLFNLTSHQVSKTIRRSCLLILLC